MFSIMNMARRAYCPRHNRRQEQAEKIKQVPRPVSTTCCANVAGHHKIRLLSRCRTTVSSDSWILNQKKCCWHGRTRKQVLNTF